MKAEGGNMCDVSRRDFLVAGSAFLSLAAEAELLAGPKPEGMTEAAKVDLVAPDVYFPEGQVSDTADAASLAAVEVVEGAIRPLKRQRRLGKRRFDQK